jgi:hypothetical protein
MAEPRGDDDHLTIADMAAMRDGKNVAPMHGADRLT